jgi:hypothetical protein
MMYGLLLLVLIIVSACGGMAALITGIVMAVKRRWMAGWILLGLLILCILLTAGSGAALAWTGFAATRSFVKRVVAEENARAQAHAALSKARVDAIKALTPDQDWSKVDDQYWNYDGFRDWFRVPIRWPYGMESIDTLDRGTLQKNVAGGRSDDPNAQCKSVADVANITHYAWDANVLLFKELRDGKTGWGAVEFDSEIVRRFSTEADLMKWAHDRGCKASGDLPSVKENFERYWE